MTVENQTKEVQPEVAPQMTSAVASQPNISPVASMPPTSEIPRVVSGFFSTYKWYIAGIAGVAIVIAVGGVIGYKIYGNKTVDPKIVGVLPPGEQLGEDPLALGDGDVPIGDSDGASATDPLVGDGSTPDDSGNGVVGDQVVPPVGNGNGIVEGPVDNGGNNGGNLVPPPAGGNNGGVDPIAPPVDDGGNAIPPAGGAAQVPDAGNVQLPAQPQVNGGIDLPGAVAVPDNNQLGGGQIPNFNSFLPGDLVSVSLDATSPKTKLVYDNSKVSLVTVKITSLRKDIKINSVVFSTGGQFNLTSDPVVKFDSKEVSATVPTPGVIILADVYRFDNLSLALTTNSSKILTYVISLKEINLGQVSGKDIYGRLVRLNFTCEGKDYAYVLPVNGNPFYVYKSFPEIVMGSLPSSILAKGTNTLSSFKISPLGGTVGWKNLVFNVSGKIGGEYIGSNHDESWFTKDGIYNRITAPGPGVAVGEPPFQNILIGKLKVYRTGLGGKLTEVTGTFSIAHKNQKADVVFTANAEQQISASTSYVLRGDIAGVLASGDSIVTKMNKVSSSVMNNTLDKVTHDGAMPAIVWTDLSAVNHSEATLDWHNDYLINSLPSVAQTLK